MFGSRPPRRGGDVLAWDLISLGSGKPWCGWLAGPPIWIATHHTNATKPCKKELTDGAVKCPYPHKQFPPRWRAYVPLWDETGTRAFTICCQRYEDQLMRVPHLAPVLIAKQAARGQPIKIWFREWCKGEPPITGAEKRPQDIRPFLVQLWNDPELREWWSANPTPPLPQYRVYAGPELAEGEGDQAPSVNRLDAHRINDAVAEVLRRVPSQNGVHKKG